MSHKDYFSQTGHDWIALHIPGDYPPQNPDRSTSSYIILLHKYFEKFIQIYQRYTNTVRALKLHIGYAVEPTYVYILHNELIRFVKFSAINMINHLYNT